MASKDSAAAKTEVRKHFAIGRTMDGFVNVTVFAKNGETVTKSITREAAREAAIQLLAAAQ